MKKFRPSLLSLEDRVTPYATAVSGLPILNSDVTAPVAIYMDFDGHVPATGAGFTPYSEDADGSMFNASEQTNIYEAWRELTAYYSAFHVNVTTEQPAADVPVAWVLISNSIGGGVSYINVFPNTEPESYNPSGDARGRVSGIAHEVGHNFGLGHQGSFDLLGNLTRQYAFATDPLHGPIMGVDFDGLVAKFIIGHTQSSPSTLQDDLAVIADKIKVHEPAGGDGFRPDEHGDTTAAATPLAASGNSLTGSGVIERLIDSDMFSFTITTAGRYLIAATPEYPSGVALKGELYSAAGVLLASANDPGNAQRVTLALAAGSYYLKVTSQGNYADIGSYNVSVSPGLPAGWSARDIGLVGKAGTSTYDAMTQTYSIAGSGADIWGTADGFQYAYQTLTGDGSITAQVTSLTNTNDRAKSGVMIRGSLDAGSPYFGVFLTPANRLTVQSRTVADDTSVTHASRNAVAAPSWIRLTRAGDILTAESSTDGITWKQITQRTIALGEQVYIGLAVTSHNNESRRAVLDDGATPTVNTTTFQDVALTGAINQVTATNTLAAPTGVAVARPASGNALTVSWNAVAGATWYTIERSANGIDFTTAGTTASAVRTFTDLELTTSRRYFYRVRANNADGVSVATAIRSEINRPAPVTNFTLTSWTNSSLILNWRDTTGDTGYLIERSTDGVNFTFLASVGQNVPSYTDTGLTDATLYFYRVIPTSDLGDGVIATASGFTRLPAVTGLTVTPVGGATLTWNGVTGADHYQVERSTQAGDFIRLGTAAGTTFTDPTAVPLTEYTYRVYAVSETGVIGVYANLLWAAPGTLPDGWMSGDVGVVGGVGVSGESGGTFTLLGSGEDIWSRADGFQFTYKTLTGDGSITARVTSVTDTGGWARAGVMIRSSLDSGSPYAGVFVTPSNGLVAQSRTKVSGSTTIDHQSSEVTAAYWVRLTRVGDTLTAYSSADGQTWTQIAQNTITLGSEVSIGLAVNSTDNTRFNTAVFDNVTVVGDVVSGDTTSPTVAISAPSLVSTSGGSITYTITYADANFAASTLTTADVTLHPTGTATGTVSVDSGTGATRTVTISGITGVGTLRISLKAGTARDSAGNLANATGPSQTVSVDSVKPTVSISAPSATVVRAGGVVTYTITYADANFATSTLSVADVTLNKTGTATGTISVDRGTGTTRTVTISGITGLGALSISIKAGTARDSAGNLANATGPSQTVSVDSVKPTVSISAPSATFVRTGGVVTYTITYADANFATSTLTAANVVLYRTGTANGTVVVTGTGKTRTVTIRNIRGSGTLRIAIMAGTAIDIGGNKAPAVGSSRAFLVNSMALASRPR